MDTFPCGHPRTPENTGGITRRLPGGRCKICLNAYHREWRRKRGTTELGSAEHKAKLSATMAAKREAARETTTHKRCPRCGETKTLDSFPPNRRMKLGVQTECRTCLNEKHRERVANGEIAAYLARRLHDGDQLRHYSAHHTGMAHLKGGRPPGTTLSLINPDSPSCYVGVGTRGEPYVLSTNPDDYVFETLSENVRRGRPSGERQRDPKTGRYA